MNLKDVKGIGINTINDLNALGIKDIYDLVTYYPFRYDVYEKSDINNLEDGEKIIVDGIVENIPSVFHFNRKLNKMSFRLNIGTKILNVTIFNRAYMKQNIKVGTELTVIGKYDLKHHSITATNIKFGLLNETIIEPVYHTNYKINSKKIKKIVNKIINDIDVLDYIPESINNKYKFMDKKRAIYYIHNPKSKTSTYEARRKLKYEELFMFMLKMNYLKTKKGSVGLKRKVDYQKIEALINNLPFKLTNDQIRSIKDIYNDLTAETRMNRLLQGDVGSGKTIVSFIALYINYLSGYQGALMAPTEILAHQHYQNFLKLFKDVKVGLLKGKLKAKERKELLEEIKTGKIDIIIGTHALISEDVSYNNLGLVITDEQHRFGVNQEET